MSKRNIFENPEKSMPSWDERPARSPQDMTDTANKARLPGMEKVSGREVENLQRPRRGHDY